MSEEKYWSIIYINNFCIGLYGDSIIESMHSFYSRYVTCKRNLTYVRRKLDSIEVNLSSLYYLLSKRKKWTEVSYYRRSHYFKLQITHSLKYTNLLSHLRII